MKFLKFLFGFGSKYSKRTRDYTKDGLWSRIGMLLTCAVLGALAVLLWRFGVKWGFSNGWMIGILILIVAITMVPSSLGETFTMSAVAIRCFVRGVAWSVIDNVAGKVDKAIDNKREAQQNKADNGIIEQNNVAGEALTELDRRAEESVKKVKSYKIFDLIASILFIGIGVAQILTYIYLLSNIGR